MRFPTVYLIYLNFRLNSKLYTYFIYAYDFNELQIGSRCLYMSMLIKKLTTKAINYTAVKKVRQKSRVMVQNECKMDQLILFYISYTYTKIIYNT